MYATGVSKASPGIPARTARDGSVGGAFRATSLARRTVRERVADAAKGRALGVHKTRGFSRGCLGRSAGRRRIHAPGSGCRIRKIIPRLWGRDAGPLKGDTTASITYIRWSGRKIKSGRSKNFAIFERRRCFYWPSVVVVGIRLCNGAGAGSGLRWAAEKAPSGCYVESPYPSGEPRLQSDG